MGQTERLRELIADDELLVSPGVVDPLSAKIAEDAGFETVYLGGYTTGAATATTEPLITMSEMCQRAQEITHTTEMPLTVDGDAGYGNATNTYRSVQEYAKSGIAAMHIEDQVHPKRLHYHAGIKHIVDVDEMVAKVQAAVQAVEDMSEDVILIARSDAARGQRRESEGETIEHAVERVNTYLDAGADVGLVFPRTMDELEFVTDEIDGPVLFPIIEGYVPLPTTAELSDLGVDWCVFPISPIVAITTTLREMYGQMYENGISQIDPETFERTREDIEELLDLPKYYEIEEQSGKKAYEGLPPSKQ